MSTTNKPSTGATDYSKTVAIVGSGPAACVLANRLLSLTAVKILMLERGSDVKDENESVMNLMDFPKGCFSRQAFQYDTSCQEGLGNRHAPIFTSNVVGGAASINASMFIAGCKSDYKFLGLSDQKLDMILQGISRKHKPRMVQQDYEQHAPQQIFLEEFQRRTGLDYNRDDLLLWNERDGIFNVPSSAQENDPTRRRLVSASYLDEIRENPRFTLRTDTNVSKILLNEKKEAVGLVCSSSNEQQQKPESSTFTLTGFRQIILCCGAIDTPTLLMKSGIGPTDELEKCGIPKQVINEHVGKGLWDHPVIFVPIKSLSKQNVPKGFPTPALVGGGSMIFHNQTVTTDGNNDEGEGSAIQTAKMHYLIASPHFLYNLPADWVIPKTSLPSPWHRSLLVKILDLLNPLLYNRSDTQLAVLGVANYTIASRGSVTLDKNTKQPIVDVGYLRDNNDVKFLANAFKECLDILRTNNMKVMIPGFDMNVGEDAAKLEEVTRTLTGPFWHYAGSCSKAVDVQRTFTVKGGVKKLRVVDASLLGDNVHANTQVPTMILAHVAASRIAQELKSVR